MTQRSGKTAGKSPREEPGREGTIDGQDPTAGGENRQHTGRVIIRTSYRAGEILESSTEQVKYFSLNEILPPSCS